MVSSPSSSSSAGLVRRSVFLGRPLPRLTGLTSVLGIGGLGFEINGAVVPLDAAVFGLDRGGGGGSGGGGILVRCRFSLLSSSSSSLSSFSDSSPSATISSDGRFLVPKIDGIG